MPTPFVAKYEGTDGDLRWARQAFLNNEMAYAAPFVPGNYGISVDHLGNSYFCGSVLTAVYDFGASRANYSDPRLLISKYDPFGALLWTKRIGGGDGQFSWDMGYSANAIATDSAGDCYVTGYFTRTAQFEGTNLVSRGHRDIFVAKYRWYGGLVWLKQAGGLSEDAGRAAAVTSIGELLIAGSFDNTANFDGATLIGSSHDVFIARLLGDPPLITAQPQSQTVIAGTNVTLRVAAASAAALRYQWRFNGTNIVDATSSQLDIASIQASDAGAYSVVITNSFGAITSAVAIVTVNFLLEVMVNGSGIVIRNPSTFVFAPGAMVTLTALAGSGHAFVAWSGDASGTNNPLVITMASNTIISAHFVAIPMGDPPSIAAQPQDQIAIAGTNIPFRITAAGTAPLRFQWRFNGTNVAGATGPEVVVTNVQAADAGAYSVVVTNLFGAITSVVATLTVRFSLDVMVNGGGAVSFDPNFGAFAPGAVVTLTAVSEAGYAFVGWSGHASGTNNPRIITMTSNITIVATFASTALTIDIDGQGFVERLPDLPYYNISDQVTLTGTPARWFQFQGWGDGPTVNPRLVTIGANNSYRAIFSPTTALETITINGATRTAPIGMPLITVNERFFSDPSDNPFLELGQADVSISTSFENGSIFYTLDGSRPSFNSTLYGAGFRLHRSTLLRAIAYDALFSNSWEADGLEINIEPLYTVNAYAYDGGAVSIMPSQSFYRSNDVVTISATPLSGWQFLQWLGDLAGTSSSTTAQVSGNLCAQALFGTTLTVAAAGNGAIVLDSSPPFYPYGTVVRLTAVPAAGNHFGAWGNAGTGTNNPLYSMVTEPQQTISAVFGELPAGQSTLTLLINGRGRVTTNPGANR